MSQSSSEDSIIEVQSIESGRIMAGIIGNMDPFDDTGEQWETYIEGFEHYIMANEIRTVKKVPVLFSVMGPKMYGFLRSLVAPDKPGEMDYGRVVDVLQAHFRIRIRIRMRILFNGQVYLHIQEMYCSGWYVYVLH